MKKYHTGKLKYGSVSALMIVMVLAALIALNAGIYALEKNKGKIKMMQVVIRAEEYGFAFRLGNTEAKAAADRVIEAKRRNGDLQALFRKYTSIYKTLELNDI